jgi:hypothetical protein
VVDEDEEDEQAERKRRRRKKRKNRDADEALDDEDLDLIGVEVERPEETQVLYHASIGYSYANGCEVEVQALETRSQGAAQSPRH